MRLFFNSSLDVTHVLFDFRYFQEVEWFEPACVVLFPYTFVGRSVERAKC